MEDRVRRFGPFEFDLPRHRLRRDGVDVHLDPKAFALLGLLIEAAPRVVPKSELHERLWPNGAVSDATLVALVKRLRRALDDRDRGMPIIRTVHRVGYAFEGALTRMEQERSSKVARWLVGGGRRLALDEGENTIGRDSQSDVQLDHLTVSRHHARILVGDRGVLLEDLGSKNGTSVGGDRVKRPTYLRDGDRVCFGHVLLTFRESSAGMPTVTQVGGIDVPRKYRSETRLRRAR
jgi:DNA-binding winged helix-turn-helix (wHTH) protein